MEEAFDSLICQHSIYKLKCVVLFVSEFVVSTRLCSIGIPIFTVGFDIMELELGMVGETGDDENFESPEAKTADYKPKICNPKVRKVYFYLTRCIFVLPQ